MSGVFSYPVDFVPAEWMESAQSIGYDYETHFCNLHCRSFVLRHCLPEICRRNDSGADAAGGNLTGGYFETDSARFVERAGDGYVACRIDPSAPEIRPEGYRLKVTRRGIDLTALDSAGLFYGRQTLCLLATARGFLRGNHR